MIEINISIKHSLRTYYKDTDTPIDEAEKARVVAMIAKQSASTSPDASFSAMPLWRFLVGQLRFVNPLAWVAQLALLIGMLLVAKTFSGSESSMLIVMAAAVLSVTIAIPSVFKSFENDVAELEASCCHNSAQVLICRLILFGLADVLWMSLVACLVPALTSGDPFRVFLYAATPFFAFCALCFYLSRLTRGHSVKACIAAACCVLAALWVANSLAPHWYSEVSMAVWSVALVVSLALAVHEAHRLISQVTLDSTTRTPYLEHAM